MTAPKPTRRKAFQELPEECDCCAAGCDCADCETCREPPVQVGQQDPGHLQSRASAKAKKRT